MTGSRGEAASALISDEAILRTRWQSSVLRACGFLRVAGQLRAFEPGAEEQANRVGEMSSQWGVACARESATSLLVGAARALGTLDAIERVLKVKLTVPGHVSEERRSLIGCAASDLFIDLLGAGRGDHERTLIAVATLPAGVVMEAEAIMRVRSTGFGEASS